MENQAFVALATELRQPLHRWWLVMRQTMRALLSDCFEDGEDLLQEARALGSRLGFAEHFWFWQTITLRWGQGRLDEIEPEVKACVAAHPENLAWRYSLIFVLAELGRQEAQSELDRVAVPASADLAPIQTWIMTLSFLAMVCYALGDALHAAEVYDRLLPYAGLNVSMAGSAVCHGAAARYLGLLATTLQRWEAAAAHFEAAIAMNERMAARPWLAHTLHGYAAMLLRQGRRADQSRAHELLNRALAIYTEFGMDSWMMKAQVLLGSAPRSASSAMVAPLSPQSSVRGPRHPDGLSEREVEVLRLLAAGKSNRDVADALVISLSTVAHHVASILTKTNSANRTEAAAWAYHRGLT